MDTRDPHHRFPHIRFGCINMDQRNRPQYLVFPLVPSSNDAWLCLRSSGISNVILPGRTKFTPYEISGSIFRLPQALRLYASPCVIKILRPKIVKSGLIPRFYSSLNIHVHACQSKNFMATIESYAGRTHLGRLRSVLVNCWDLGLTSFGGPNVLPLQYRLFN